MEPRRDRLVPGRRPRRARSLLAVLSATAAGLALAGWPPAAGYGWYFYVWLLAMASYACSFPGSERSLAPPSRGALLTLAALLVLALGLRLPALESVPANIANDEILPGYEAMRIAAGESPNPFSHLGWFTIPGFAFAIPGAVMWLTGSQPFEALRLSSVLTGLAGIVFTFLLARRLFNDRVALISAFFLAVGFWHLHNSRTGFPFVQTSCFVPLVLYGIVRARQARSLRGMAIAGLVCGLALQCYFPVRALLMLAPLFLLGSWLAQRESPRRALAEAVVFGIGALLMLAPLLRSVSAIEVLGRSQSVLITRPAVQQELGRVYRVDGLPAIAWRNLQEAAGMLTEWADVCILNRSPDGLFDDVTLIAIAVGALLAVGQARVEGLLLIAWAGLVFVLGSGLTDAPRASYRLGPALPAFVMLAAFAVEQTLLVRPPPQRWYRLTVLPAILIVLGAWVGLRNFELFFVDYSSKGDGRIHPVAAAWRFTKENCDGRQFYFVATPEPTGSEAMLDIFCPDHAAIRPEDVPLLPDPGRAATFVVMAWQRQSLPRLTDCYPTARVEEHRAPDRRYLFTSVEVDVEGVRAGPRNCPEPAVIELDLTPRR